MNEVEQAIAADTEARLASEFADALNPQSDVDYEWVADVAKGRYDAIIKTFDDLDAKAAAIVGYLGSGTGLITLGAFFTALNATVSAYTVAAVIPSVAFAACSLLCAARARNTATVYPPPTAQNLVKIANEFGKDTGKAKAVMAAQWDVCTALMRPVVVLKGRFVDSANFYFAWAVLTLTLPLLVSVARRLLGYGP